LGGSLSGQQRISWQAQKQSHSQRQRVLEGAHAAATVKGTYLRDKFYRRGYKRAAVAIAHKILVSIYHMLSHNASYNDLGDLYLDKFNKSHLTRNLVRRLERLGFSVTLTFNNKRPSRRGFS
jgi:hypothetical protein